MTFITSCTNNYWKINTDFSSFTKRLVLVVQTKKSIIIIINGNTMSTSYIVHHYLAMTQ
jgi:hypothetical protein